MQAPLCCPEAKRKSEALLLLPTRGREGEAAEQGLALLPVLAAVTKYRHEATRAPGPKSAR
jgi:hypothetical protein